MPYIARDTYANTTEILNSESDVITLGKDYAEKINSEKESNDKPVQVDDLDDAIDVLESVNIYIKQKEGV